MVRKKKIATALDSITSLPRSKPTTKKKKFIRLPYLSSYTQGLAKILNRYNLQPVYYNSSTISRLFTANKDPIPTWSKSGVYI